MIILHHCTVCWNILPLFPERKLSLFLSFFSHNIQDNDYSWAPLKEKVSRTHHISTFLKAISSGCSFHIFFMNPQIYFHIINILLFDFILCIAYKSNFHLHIVFHINYIVSFFLCIIHIFNLALQWLFFHKNCKVLVNFLWNIMDKIDSVFHLSNIFFYIIHKISVFVECILDKLNLALSPLFFHKNDKAFDF